MLCSEFHARAFLTLMSFSDELIQETRYLKSFSTCNVWPSAIFNNIGSSVLKAITLVFLVSDVILFFLYSDYTLSNNSLA